MGELCKQGGVPERLQGNTSSGGGSMFNMFKTCWFGEAVLVSMLGIWGGLSGQL